MNAQTGGSGGKQPACNVGDINVFDPWVGKIPWRRAWQPTLVFLPGESPWTEEPGGYSSWGCKELDTAEQLSTYIIRKINAGHLFLEWYTVFII